MRGVEGGREGKREGGREGGRGARLTAMKATSLFPTLEGRGLEGVWREGGRTGGREGGR